MSRLRIAEIRVPIEYGGRTMTISPHQISDAMHLYHRVAKLKPSTLLAKETVVSKDIVNISKEAKKQQIVAQAKTEVLDCIRNAK